MPPPRLAALCLAVWLSLAFGVGSAGVHNSAEPPLDRSAQPAEFLEQLRLLRGLGPPDPLVTTEDSPARLDYLKKIAELRARQAQGPLSPDDLANLGAYLIRVRKTETRLPDYQEAVVVLEAAYRAHPRHFAILANLGTVYQLNGMLDAAERLLEQAVGVAPPEWARFEAFQLRLVQARLHEPRRTGPIGLDLLFNRSRREPPVFLDPESPWRVGRLSERDRLLFPNGSPVEAMQIVQQLLLWLPDDGRLLWMYAEMLNAFAQPRPALQAMTLAVDLFRLSAPELRQRRQILREYLTWAGILDRVGTVADQRIWFARTAARASASAAVGLPLVAIDDWLPLTKAKALIDPAALLGKKSEGDPLPAEFDWSKLPWPPIVGGAAVVLMLIFLQMREWWRRLRRAQRPA